MGIIFSILVIRLLKKRNVFIFQKRNKYCFTVQVPWKPRRIKILEGVALSITTLSIITLSITTLSITTLSITTMSLTTFSKTTLSMKGLFAILFVGDSQHNNTLHTMPIF
jgi:hypothetical protein